MELAHPVPFLASLAQGQVLVALLVQQVAFSQVFNAYAVLGFS